MTKKIADIHTISSAHNWYMDIKDEQQRIACFALVSIRDSHDESIEKKVIGVTSDQISEGLIGMEDDDDFDFKAYRHECELEPE